MEVTLGEELNLRKASTVLTSAAITGLFILTYLPTFVDLLQKYSAIDSYYSHGYLIPLMSAFVIWRKRGRLKSMPIEPFRAGLWVLIGGVLLHLAADWLYVNVVANASMVIVLAGLSLYLFGAAITRELAFPLAFLFFMVPLPKISIIYITFWLKLMAAWAATEVVSAMGVPVLLQGALIELPNGPVEVDNACSGLRSLIALMALGVFYAHLLPVSFAKKCLFVIAAAPIAVAANLIRIVILLWVSYLYGPRGLAFERADFTTGLLVFVVALAGLYLASRGTQVWERRRAAGVVPT